MRSLVTSEKLEPQFEGFCVTAKDGSESEVKKAVDAVLPGWSMERFGKDSDDFEVLPEGEVSVEEAWNLTYELRRDSRLAEAEPLFTFPVPENSAGPMTELCFGGGGDGHLPGTADPEWSVRQVCAPQAWDLAKAKDRPLGGGIRIAHPDTGFRRHPEIADFRLRSDLGWDFVDGDAHPLDPLIDNGILLNPGHGTGTSSVIISAVGSPYPTGERFVTGIAPEAELVPLRVTKSVVLISMRNLKHAIHKAIDDGFPVISISLGGLPSRGLHRAVREAVRKGIIVLAAAGNFVKFVTWPAAYDEVVAVAASNVKTSHWSGSCRGEKVDIAAPGESVWRARVRKLAEGVVQYDVERSSGTSYAVAITAGAAALWLAFHGRDRLLADLGPENLTPVFRNILRTQAFDTPADWHPGLGPGILNIEKLLRADVSPLPAAAVADGVAEDPLELFRVLLVQPSEDGDELDRPPEDDEELPSRLGALLETPGEDLEATLKEVGEELIFHIATDPELRDEIAPRGSWSRRPKASGKSVAVFDTETRADSLRAPMRRIPESQHIERTRHRILAKALSEHLRKKMQTS